MNKPLDLRGREIDLGGYSGDLKKGLAAGMLSAVKKVKDFTKPDKKPSSELKSVVDKLLKLTNNKGQKEYSEELLRDILEIEKNQNKKSSKIEKSIKNSAMWGEKLYKASQSKHSLHNTQNSFESKALHQLIEAIYKAEIKSNRAFGGGRGGGGWGAC